MRVLIACEYSGIVREAFRARGHDAWSCDVLPSEHPGPHYQCDVREVLNLGWDMMIAHPPCTYLSYAGMASWNAPGRAEKRETAMRFFMELINAPIPKICVENPRGLPCQTYRAPDQVIHPYFFGDRQLKRTCLWLKGLAPLWWWDKPGSLFEVTATEFPEPVYSTIRENGLKLRHFTEARHGQKARSRSFQAIALAMANQWG